MADVVYGAEVTFGLSGGGTVVPEQMMEISRATWNYTPQTKTRWPAGAKKPKIHPLGGHWEVTLEGHMVGEGFGPIIAAQAAAIDAGKIPPKITLSISKAGHSFTGGVISGGGGSLSGGDTEVTTTITVLFDDNANWEAAPVGVLGA